QNRFVEIPARYHTLTYDLDTVQFITPGKFTIISTAIDDPDVMKFELNALDIFRKYCTRPDGKYPAPAELPQLGPPDDLPVEEVEVRRDSAHSFKGVSWRYPYRRLLPKNVGWLTCQRKGETESNLYWEQHNLIANGVQDKEIFDCKRGL